VRERPAHLLTAAQVAEAWSVSEWWVAAEARAGRLPHYRLGRAVRFDLGELEAWLAEQHRGGDVGAMVPPDVRRARGRGPAPPLRLAQRRRPPPGEGAS
jgi:excisionase family DNA binding protein